MDIHQIIDDGSTRIIKTRSEIQKLLQQTKSLGSEQDLKLGSHFRVGIPMVYSVVVSQKHIKICSPPFFPERLERQTCRFHLGPTSPK